MSVTDPVRERPEAAARDRSGLYRRLGLGVAVFVLLALVRELTGSNDMISSGSLRAALIASIPIALAGLGGLWSERAGVVNIGLEGMMIMGTLGAGYFGYQYGVYAGLGGAILFGASFGLIHAIVTVYIGVDHIVSGVAINIIAAGLAAFLAKVFFSGLVGGGPTQSPVLPKTFPLPLDFIADPARTLEAKHWFFVSDLAGVVGAVTYRISWFTVLALLLIALTSWILWRTAFGLRLRSVGESPSAAESLGVDVFRYKVIAVVMSGALAGLGGAYLAMVASSGYQNGQTLGLGYIGLAAMIFGNWRPGGLLVAALLFGYTQSINLRGGTDSLHSLLVVIAVLLIALAAWNLRERAFRQAVMLAAGGGAFLLWWATTESVSSKFTGMAPYVTTLLVLAFASQRLRMPAADGQVYRKGSAG